MLTDSVYQPRPDPHHFGAAATIHRQVSTPKLESHDITWLPMYFSQQAYRSISKCVAAICNAVPDQIFPTVSKFIEDIKVHMQPGKK